MFRDRRSRPCLFFGERNDAARCWGLVVGAAVALSAEFPVDVVGEKSRGYRGIGRINVRQLGGCLLQVAAFKRL